MSGHGNLGFRLVKILMFLNRVRQGAVLSQRSGSAHPGPLDHGDKQRGCLYKPAIGLSVPLLGGCAGPLSTLDPAGPSADLIANLWWIMLSGAGLITALVLLLILLAWRRPARTVTDDSAGEKFWTLGLGIGFTLTVLVALVGYGLWVGERLLTRDDGTFRVSAHAMQWGWEFTQPGPDATPITTTGVLYVPAGQPFDIDITSSDVIHSFWVPRLGGKLDAVPGRINRARLSADAPGTYEGLCAEFCGLGHTTMRFNVVVYPAGNFPDLPDSEPRP